MRLIETTTSAGADRTEATDWDAAVNHSLPVDQTLHTSSTGLLPDCPPIIVRLRSVFTDHLSGPGIAMGPWRLCVPLSGH